MEPLLDRKYNEREAAEILGLKVRTLQRMRLEQRGPGWLKYDKKSIRYAAGDLSDYIEAARRGGEAASSASLDVRSEA